MYSMTQPLPMCSFFFFNDTATTEIYTLSLHDALPILARHTPAERPLNASSRLAGRYGSATSPAGGSPGWVWPATSASRSEEHTSELQSPCNLVCRLLLEKKKKYRPADRL